MGRDDLEAGLRATVAAAAACVALVTAEVDARLVVLVAEDQVTRLAAP